MKLLTLTLNRMELARTQLRKPLIVVGRSPTCDVVLRAPGIKPIHYIIEWIGDGAFSPKRGQWSIVDVSTHSDAGQGLVLGVAPLKLGDISFTCVESGLESSEIIGGKIVDNLGTAGNQVSDLLEFVQVRIDSGAIEEIRHIPLQDKIKPISLSHEFKEFKIERNGIESEQLLKVLLQELPGAELFLSGRKVSATADIPLKLNDFLQVKWKGRDFYLRFVEAVKVPPAKVDFWGEPFLKYLSIGVAAVMLLFFGFRTNTLNKPAEVVPPVRVARVEVPPPPAPPANPPSSEKNEVKEKVELTKPSAAAAGAASVVMKPKAEAKAGLNVNAASANVNKLGILGALNKNTNKGAGVQADRLIHQGVVAQAVSAKDDSKIVISTSPAGVIGKGAGGDPAGKTSAGLGSASTTLSGVNKPSGDSKSLIARSGGTGESALGSETSGNGTSTNAIGEGAGSFTVSGGLDKDTVRKIIQSYRPQVRACYDRALVASPNLQGRISYSWKILPDGSVTDAKILKDTMDSANLKTCVLGIIKKMQFPKAPNEMSTAVIYPFVFQGK